MTHDQQAADLIGHDYAVRLASIGIDTPLKLSADATDWYDLDSGESGVQSEGAQSTGRHHRAGRASTSSERS